MSNVISFPDQSRIEVSMGTDTETGKRVYTVVLVEGSSRKIHSTHEDVRPMLEVIRRLMLNERYDVVWDEPTRRQLLIESRGET